MLTSNPDLPTREGETLATAVDAPALIRRTLKRSLAPLLGVLMASLALAVIYRAFHAVTLESVLVALAAIPTASLLAGAVLTVLSFAAIAAYDIVAVEVVVPGRISRNRAGAAGAAGYAVSNALGFPIVTQAAVRYRLYSPAAISVADIGRIVGASWFALWASLFTMGAVALLFVPALPAVMQVHPVSSVATGALGLVLVATVLMRLGSQPRAVILAGFTIRLPSTQAALLQIAAGVVDLAAAAGVLYVLLPADVAIGFPAFLLVYVLATVAGIVSHAPGGIGAFEVTLLTSLGLYGRPDVLSALLAYRILYTVLPFAASVVGVAALEAYRHRRLVTAPLAAAGRLLEPIVPRAAGGLALAGGLGLLASVATPDLSARIDALSEQLPLPFVQGSRFAAVSAALVLLVLSRGLSRRLARAWSAALALLVFGAAFSLGKGFDWAEACFLTVLALLLVASRTSFYRRPHGPLATLNGPSFATATLLLAAAICLGVAAQTHAAAANEAWRAMAWDGNGHGMLTLSFALVAGLAAVGFDGAVNRRSGQPDRASIPDTVRDIVATAPQAGAALALLGDKQFLPAPDGRAFVMYARSGGSLVALGEPVGPSDSVAERAWAFRETADRAAARTVFYGVGPENLPLFLDMGLTALKLGEVARVPLAGFTLKGPARHDLRYGARRAEKEGLTFAILAKAEVPAAMEDLRTVSDAWLAMKNGGEKRFSLGFFDPAYLAEFDVAVMRKEGRIVAFANLWRGARRHEIAIDLIRYTPDASKVIMDALFANLMLAAQAEGYAWFNLGAAPLSGLVDRPLASRWNRFGAFLYRRGADLYSFDGLRTFKQKFDPVWTPYYLICPGGMQTPKALLDVATLVNGSPLSLIRG